MTPACTRACRPLPWPASPPRIRGETASGLGPWTSARVAWEGGRVVGEMPGGIAVRDGGGSLRAAGLRNGSDDPECRWGRGGPGRPCVAGEHAASPSTEGFGRAGRVPSGVAMDAEKEGTLHFEGDAETGISAHRFPPGEKLCLRMRCSGPRRSCAACLLPAVRPAQALGAGVLLCSPSSPQSLARGPAHVHISGARGASLCDGS